MARSRKRWYRELQDIEIENDEIVENALLTLDAHKGLSAAAKVAYFLTEFVFVRMNLLNQFASSILSLISSVVALEGELAYARARIAELENNRVQAAPQRERYKALRKLHRVVRSSQPSSVRVDTSVIEEPTVQFERIAG